MNLLVVIIAFLKSAGDKLPEAVELLQNILTNAIALLKLIGVQIPEASTLSTEDGEAVANFQADLEAQGIPLTTIIKLLPLITTLISIVKAGGEWSEVVQKIIDAVFKALQPAS